MNELNRGHEQAPVAEALTDEDIENVFVNATSLLWPRPGKWKFVYLNSTNIIDFARALLALRPTREEAVALQALLKESREWVDLGASGNGEYRMDFLARLDAALRSPARPEAEALTDDELIELGRHPTSRMRPWGIGSSRADFIRAVRAALRSSARKSADEGQAVRYADIITALERSAANTDTDPRWRAADALRQVGDWQSRALRIAQPKEADHG